MNPSSLFGLTEHLAQLSKHGDPLEVLDATVGNPPENQWC